MSIPFYGDRVPEGLVHDFRNSTSFHLEDEFLGRPHLADFFYTWLVNDKGARKCGNNQVTALSVLLLSWADLQEQADQWSPVQDMGGIERPALTLIDAKCGFCRLVLDPQFFQLLVADPDWEEHRLF